MAHAVSFGVILCDVCFMRRPSRGGGGGGSTKSKPKKAPGYYGKMIFVVVLKDVKSK